MSSVRTWRVLLLVGLVLGVGWAASQLISGGSISDQAVVETTTQDLASEPPDPTTTTTAATATETASSDATVPDDLWADESSTGSGSASTASGSVSDDDAPNLDPTALIAAASHGGEEELAFEIVSEDTDAVVDTEDGDASAVVETDAELADGDDAADDNAADENAAGEDAADDGAAGEDATDEDATSAADDDTVEIPATEGTDEDDDEGTSDAAEAAPVAAPQTTTTSIYIDPDSEADEEEVQRVQAAQAEAARAAETAAANREADLNPVPTQQVSGTANPPKETVSQVTTSASLHETEYGPDGLPILLPLPTNPYEKTPDIQVGRIRIPALGVDHSLHQGMTLTAINRGPSQWPGTALPGQPGNMVIGGHRTTYSRPFRHLDDLKPGDEIIYDTNQGSFTYNVTAVEIVQPEDVGIVAHQTTDRTATLFACHPPGSARQRIIVKMAMAES